MDQQSTFDEIYKISTNRDEFSFHKNKVSSGCMNERYKT